MATRFDRTPVRRLLALAVLLLAPLLCAATPGGEGRTVLVFGDSLSAGYGIDLEQSWVRLLEARLADFGAGYHVVNASISGETTRGGRARIEETLRGGRPEIVIVELGGNDGLRGIDLATTRQNLDHIVSRSIGSGAKVLLLAMELPPNYGSGYIDRFRSIYQDIGAKQGVRLVPFFLRGVAENPSLMQADGIHPTAEAQPKLLENVWPYLQPLLSE